MTYVIIYVVVHSISFFEALREVMFYSDYVFQGSCIEEWLKSDAYFLWIFFVMHSVFLL